MSSIFYELAVKDFINKDDAYLIVNHDQQYKVYLEIAKKLGIDLDHVTKPTHFINTHKQKKAGVVLIDEAHLLLTQGKQSYTGKNQLYDILNEANVVVAVLDLHQILTTEQFWEKDELSKLMNNVKSKHDFIRLKNQMRINAAPQTVEWIRNFIDEGQIGEIPKHDSRNYEIKIFNDPKEMYEAIREKNNDQEKGISRVVATYDWDYKKTSKKDGKFWNVKINDFDMPWNLQLPLPLDLGINKKNVSWAEQPQTINEVGSTYTVQGFDLNYVGVIIGPSVKFRNGNLIFDPSESSNEKAIRNRTLKNGKKRKFGETFLRNELNVLLTRGVNGLYIYAVDSELRKQLNIRR